MHVVDCRQRILAHRKDVYNKNRFTKLPRNAEANYHSNYSSRLRQDVQSEKSEMLEGDRLLFANELDKLFSDASSSDTDDGFGLVEPIKDPWSFMMHNKLYKRWPNPEDQLKIASVALGEQEQAESTSSGEFARSPAHERSRIRMIAAESRRMTATSIKQRRDTIEAIARR